MTTRCKLNVIIQTFFL